MRLGAAVVRVGLVTGLLQGCGASGSDDSNAQASTQDKSQGTSKGDKAYIRLVAQLGFEPDGLTELTTDQVEAGSRWMAEGLSFEPKTSGTDASWTPHNINAVVTALGMIDSVYPNLARDVVAGRLSLRKTPSASDRQEDTGAIGGLMSISGREVEVEFTFGSLAVTEGRETEVAVHEFAHVLDARAGWMWNSGDISPTWKSVAGWSYTESDGYTISESGRAGAVSDYATHAKVDPPKEDLAETFLAIVYHLSNAIPLSITEAPNPANPSGLPDARREAWVSQKFARPDPHRWAQ